MESRSDSKSYLGDGVYGAVDGFGSIILTTEDGISVTNRIVLEPEVLDTFLRYLERLKAAVLIPHREE
jgi:hypothetical protein